MSLHLHFKGIMMEIKSLLRTMVVMNSDSLTKATRVAIFLGDTRTTVKIPNPKY